jgi:hypothetical protein
MWQAHARADKCFAATDAPKTCR